jgi:hypothetical protein
MKYAAQTEVSSERSRNEIEKTLKRYGATHFMYGWQTEGAVVAFQMHQKAIKFLLPLPDRNSREFTHTPTKKLPRGEKEAEAAYEQATRQRWRALSLCIKAKLEAVKSGITSFEQEFMAHFMMPDGKTLSEHILPQLEEASRSGKMPTLLLGM